MNLLPQDVVVMVKLAVSASENWTYDRLAHDLDMSPSMAYNAVKRSKQAGLYDLNNKRPNLKALEEFLIHGVKYAYPPDVGGLTRGVPTAFASPGLKNHTFQGKPKGEYYVWPYPEGDYRGMSLSPLYKSVPEVALTDSKLYEALGLIDAIRIGRAGERKLAEQLLAKMLKANHDKP